MQKIHNAKEVFFQVTKNDIQKMALETLDRKLKEDELEDIKSLIDKGEVFLKEEGIMSAFQLLNFIKESFFKEEK